MSPGPREADPKELDGIDPGAMEALYPWGPACLRTFVRFRPGTEEFGRWPDGWILPFLPAETARLLGWWS